MLFGICPVVELFLTKPLGKKVVKASDANFSRGITKDKSHTSAELKQDLPTSPTGRNRALRSCHDGTRHNPLVTLTDSLEDRHTLCAAGQ
jgi:hypothetical protein